MGVPQGSLISPLLSNIYLNELDKYIEGYIETRSSMSPAISKVNPKIVKFSTELTKLTKEYKLNKDRAVIKQIRALRAERNLLPNRIRVGTRIHYVRYADD